MNKQKKIFLITQLIIILLMCIYLVWFYFSGTQKKAHNKDEIKNFNYVLKQNDTEVYEQYFLQLKTELSKEKIDYEQYAILISNLFVIDFYTLNNKLDKYDIGGSQYIHPDALENFKLKATNTIYKNINPNYENNRTQQLPIVKKITESVFNDYEITLKWEYEEDLEYEDTAIIKIVKVDEKLYIVEKK